MDYGRRNTKKYSFRCPDLKELRKLSSFVLDPLDFKKRHGKLLSILSADVVGGLLSMLVQFYDPLYRCFTFPDFQLVPTVAGYSLPLEILTKSKIFLTQPGSTTDEQTSGTTSQERKPGPVENIQSDEGKVIPGNKDLCRGIHISHSNWGLDHHTDKLRRRSNSIGEIIRGEDGPPRNNHQAETPRITKYFPTKEITSAEEEGGMNIFTKHPAREKNHKRLRRKRTQAYQEYEQMSYPVEDHTIFGRALKTS
ncbi:hypothetical protein KIW84_030636 [Lathyrus oleraceus]|uniref:DUF7745 domain-containing protein n=1 Tax=Pisum sativum TaxID=3888 RepID=A0A9D4XT66_PEA|nr:hypothetical protein KIW84_030636 [Pisum sativum]